MQQLMRACGESLLEMLPDSEECGVVILVSSPNSDGWQNAYYSATGMDAQEQAQLVGTALFTLHCQQEELLERQERMQ